MVADIESALVRVGEARALLKAALVAESPEKVAHLVGEAHHTLGSAMQMIQSAVDLAREFVAQEK